MDKDIKHLGELLKDFTFCQFVTVSPEAELTSRLMTLQEPRPDAALWFAADKEHLPAAHLYQDPRVNLSFHRDSDHAWISLSGVAKLNESPRMIQDLWQDDWDIWFSDHNKANVVLIEIEPRTVTFWEPEKGKLSQMASILKTKFTNAKLDFAPNRTCHPSKTDLAATMG